MTTYPRNVIAFGARLLEHLEALRPPRTQAWLAEESGVSTSVISRIVSGDRPPTPAVIESLAPMLGVEPSHLVFGTDAEARYRASGELVRKEMYEATARQVADDQVRIAELERRLESLPATLEELGRTHHDLDRARRDLGDLRIANKELRADVHRYQNGLAQAVAKYAALQSQLATLASELSSTSKASRASAILAAVGAITGVVTVAHFLSDDEPPIQSDSPPPKKHRRKARKND